mmetsp:Transcript_21229/g.49882  ORF Transcript_21229/g.49882 Transcript_21229/m.49882 type:complete len:205 (+) Transcript_21229:616-1230(+)
MPRLAQGVADARLLVGDHARLGVEGGDQNDVLPLPSQRSQREVAVLARRPAQRHGARVGLPGGGALPGPLARADVQEGRLLDLRGPARRGDVLVAEGAVPAAGPAALAAPLVRHLRKDEVAGGWVSVEVVAPGAGRLVELPDVLNVRSRPGAAAGQPSRLERARRLLKFLPLAGRTDGGAVSIASRAARARRGHGGWATAAPIC